MVAPFSGPATANGESFLAGVRGAADGLNRQGGIGGYRVAVIAGDELNPSTPADLIADPAVLAVVGHLEPDPSAAAGRYRKANLAWLAAQPVGTSEGYPLVGTAATADQALRTGLRQGWGLSAAAAQSVVRACRAAQDTGGAVVPATGGDLICGLPANRVEETLLATGAGQRLACVGGCDAPEIARWAGGMRLEVLSPFPPFTPTAPLARELADRGVAASTPGYAALGYDAVEIVAEAVERARSTGPPSRPGVAQAVIRTRYQGLLGGYGPSGATSPRPELRPARGQN